MAQPLQLHRRLARLTGLVAAGLSVAQSATAAEVKFEGYYRARARGFDTLSIDRNLVNSEGQSLYVQHRLWLRPQIVVDEHISMFVDFRALDGTDWGSDQTNGIDFDDTLNGPATDSAGRLVDFATWRAWAQIDTSVGRFTFGRMPLHFGLGVWQNDGLSWNGEYGDSADRISWNKTFDRVYTQLAVDVNAEGFRNADDDSTSFNGALGYKSETVNSGLQAQLRRSSARDFRLFTLDGALQAEMGTIDLGLEAIGQFGSGTLEDGTADANIAAFGAALTTAVATSKVNIGLDGGLASGDSDPTDLNVRRFTFDRDFNVGLLMFEQPLPTFAAAATSDENQGRNTDAALIRNGVSNALYVRPTIGKNLRDDLVIEGTVIAARTAKALATAPARTGYGVEFDAKLRYRPNPHVDLGATFAVFRPGSYFTQYSDDTYSGFSGTVYGGEVISQVRF